MRMLLNGLAAGAIVIATSATAQSTSYESNRPAPITGNPDKIVCKKEEKIGSRLQATKVCLTVREWQARYEADREMAEDVQSGVRARCDQCPDSMGKVF